MIKSEILVLTRLAKGENSLSQLARMTGLSISRTSQVVKSLAEKGLAEKNGKVRLAVNQKSRALIALAAEYSLEKTLVGARERMLIALLEPKPIEGLMVATCLKRAAVYRALEGLKEIGAVKLKDKRYSLVGKQSLQRYVSLLAEETTAKRVEPHATLIHSNGALLKKSPHGLLVKGFLTAFSRFSEHGVPVETSWDYYSDKEPSIEEILVHAFRAAETRSEKSLCGIFFLKNQQNISMRKAYHAAEKSGVAGELGELLAYLRDHDNRGKYLPWAEFLDKATLYGAKIPECYQKAAAETVLWDIGRALPASLDAYVLGGQNMMARGMKTATKDIDLVVASPAVFDRLAAAIERIGYKKMTSVGAAYRKMHPSAIFERIGSPRIDVFTRTICRAMVLTGDMQKESEKTQYDRLRIGLLPLDDIFLFKSITEREGDFEDVAAIVRMANLDWKKIYSRLEAQENETGLPFTLAVLDTIELLEERLGIIIPIKKKLIRRALDSMLLVSLVKPGTLAEMAKLVDFPVDAIQRSLVRLEKAGKISKKGGRYAKIA